MSKRVMVVDDDEDMQELLQAALEIEDYEVVTAENGITALEKLEAGIPDLILLDLMMPRMDGYTFAQELNKRGLQSSIPIIVLSADVNAGQRVQQMGAESYITKPFDLMYLLGQVSRCIQQRTPPTP